MKKLLLFGAIALSINAFGQVPNYVPSNGLIGWWPFNGNANDESGNSNDGTVNGATLANDRNAVPNSAYSFDGNDWIEVNHNAMFDFQTNNVVSVSIWFETAMPSGAVFLQKQAGNGTTQNGFNIGLLNGTGEVTGISSTSGGTASIILTSSSGYNNSVWHHYVYVYNNQVATIYLDGAEIITQTDAGSIVGNSITNLIFGYGLPENSFFLTGKLDDIGVWNVALSACEAQDLFLAGTMTDVTQVGTLLTADQAGATYQWLDCDDNNVQINGETNQSYTPSVTGNYSVEVTLNGCVDTSACFLIDYTGIEELLQNEKELVKIVDFMGRETKYKPNIPLIFIYSDGTRERVMKLEE